MIRSPSIHRIALFVLSLYSVSCSRGDYYALTYKVLSMLFLLMYYSRVDSKTRLSMEMGLIMIMQLKMSYITYNITYVYSMSYEY